MPGLNDYTDELLLDLLKQGDRQGFSEIYNRYWNKLFVVAYKRLKDSFSAEEVVQNVFVALWNKRETLEIQMLSVYLSAMTRYAVYKALAKEKRKLEVEKMGSDRIYKNESPESTFENKAILEFIQKLTHILPEKCRMVFIHNKLLDQPLDEVANSMGISIKTAEAHITKALKIVRSKLGDNLSMFLL